MDPWVTALILKPLGAFLIFGCIAFPLRWLAHKHLPDGRLKRLLLTQLWESPLSDSNRKLWAQGARQTRRYTGPVGRIHRKPLIRSR